MKEDNKQSKYFTLAIGLLAFFVVAFSYYNFFIKNDFEVIKQIDCDPQIDSCFVSDCDSNDSECDTETTYKKITAPSKYAGSDYESFTCVSGDPHCQIITCSDATVEAGEKCFK